MGTRLGKPILACGLGLTIVLNIWNTLGNKAGELGEWGLLALTLVGAGFWFFKRPGSVREIPPVPLDRSLIDREIARTRLILNTIGEENPGADLSAFESRIGNLDTATGRNNLNIAIVGAKGTGKTALKNLLNYEGTEFIETGSPLSPDPETADNALATALNSDLALYIIDGDLKDSEWRIIRDLDRLYLKTIVLLNKQDRYPAGEREEIILSVREKIKDTIGSRDVFAIATAPPPIKVRKYRESGEVIETEEEREADIKNLETDLTAILEKQKESLILGRVWREVLNIKKDAKTLLNAHRKERALPIITKYQWIAGGTAFANPVAVLDLVAIGAVTAQMLIDTGAIYGQKLSLENGKNLAETMAKLMVKLGMVEITTQTIGAILKGNALTYIAGGTLQGVSAAYLTRIAGLSSIEYFQELEVSIAGEGGLNIDRLRTTLQRVFEVNQRTAFLRDFVNLSIPNLKLSKAAD